MMVGRVIYEDPKTQNMVPKDAPVVLKVDHLNAGKMVKDVSFELHKGEILGFSGLMGAGRTETARALFGADPIDSGDIYINGKKVDIRVRKMQLEMVSDIFQKTERDTESLFRNLLQRTLLWQQWNTL